MADDGDDVGEGEGEGEGEGDGGKEGEADSAPRQMPDAHAASKRLRMWKRIPVTGAAVWLTWAATSKGGVKRLVRWEKRPAVELERQLPRNRGLMAVFSLGFVSSFPRCPLPACPKDGSQRHVQETAHG